ncbi:MAG: type II toxin-antitoxin system RelE/ParE family toxin [Spirochaetes bacterium]|nr:type II toxin-antitoxin system RelE/ParE family toxin [Paludibacteraceae bacterium]MBP9044044.1 type II toxin-antitoxin system RelE/ParE family toxin [Spirochaetota bacterium]
MYKAIILPAAKEDIRDAALWYEGKQNGLGKRFTGQVREKVSFIKKNPKACSIRYDSVRTAVLSVFPFMLHYVVDESSKAVIVYAVLHTSRDPGLWEKKHAKNTAL